MAVHKVIKIISPYCEEIRFKSNHYVCRLPNELGSITISATPSDRNFNKQVYRDFRRKGIIIDKLLNI